MTTAMCSQCGEPVSIHKDHYRAAIDGKEYMLHPSCWDAWRNTGVKV